MVDIPKSDPTNIIIWSFSIYLSPSRGHKNMKRQPTGLTKEVSHFVWSGFPSKACEHFSKNLPSLKMLNDFNFPTFHSRTLQMFAGGKRWMVKREMWTVSQAWEAPGDFSFFRTLPTLGNNNLYRKQPNKINQQIWKDRVRSKGNVEINMQSPNHKENMLTLTSV